MTIRKNITQPADWWAAFEAEATRQNLPLSKWIGKVLKASLPYSVSDELSERKGVGQPRKSATTPSN